MRSDGGVGWDRSELIEVMNSLTGVPAFMHDRYLTVLGTNPLAVAVSPLFESGVNLARATFLDPHIDRDSDQWSGLGEEMTALLWAAIERFELDLPFVRIIGELTAQSQAFSQAWAHRPRQPRARGRIAFETVTGQMTLAYIQLSSPVGEDVLVLWRAVDSLSASRLKMLAAMTSRPVRPIS